MTIWKRAGWILACALAATLAAGAQSQQPAPKPEEKKPVKKKKVWTQEDLAGLRTSADKYADKKAAEESAAKAAAEQKPPAEQQPATGAEEQKVIDPETGKPYVDPESAEGLQQQMTKWEASLAATEKQLTEARSRLAQTTDPQRWDTAKMEVELLEQNVTDTRQRIEELKGKIAAAKATKPEGAPKPPAPPQPPPQ